MWLFILLIAVPILEIALFIEIGGWLGLWPTIAVVVLTAIIGAALLRAQGLAALTDLQSRLDRGADPRAPLAHGALILVAGVVLLTPGFFTDTVGFLLLVPAVRAGVIRFAARRIHVVHMQAGQSGPATPDPSEQTVETTYEEVTKDDASRRRR